MRLELEVEFQFYGESDNEKWNQVNQLRNVLISVIDLMQVSVGTFVTSNISDGVSNDN